MRKTIILASQGESSQSSISSSSVASANSIELLEAEALPLPALSTWSSHQGSVYALLEMNDNWIISGSHDKNIQIWQRTVDIETAQPVFAAHGHTQSVSVLLKLTQDKFLSASQDNTIKCWHFDEKSGNAICIATWRGHKTGVSSLLLISPHRVVSGSTDGEIKCWNIEANGTAQCLATWRGHTNRISALVHVGNEYILSASHDGTVRCWQINIERGTAICVSRCETGKSIAAMALLPNKWLLTTSTLDNDITCRRWDEATHQVTLLTKWVEHTSPVLALVVTTGGNVFSGGQDKTIKQWHYDAITAEGSCVLTYIGHTSYVLKLIATTDGLLLSSGMDNNICCWQGLVPLYNLSIKACIDRAYYHLTQKQDKAAIDLYQLAASRGHLESQQVLTEMGHQGIVAARFALAELYTNGIDGIIDASAAIDWYGLAAEQGHQEALTSLQTIAAEGNVAAQLQLGKMYHLGQGVKVDYHQAMCWFFTAAQRGERKAITNLHSLAESGHAEGQYVLGECAAKGFAMDIDIEQAIVYYHLSAKQWHEQAKAALKTLGYQGHVQAQRYLGLIYELGEGTKCDTRQATFWLQLAAENGDNQTKMHLKGLADLGCVDAKASYGALCLKQATTLADEKIAYGYLKQAIEHNHVEACLYLGLIYEYGLAGLTPSLHAAVFFYRKAAANSPLTSMMLGLGYLRQLNTTSYNSARKAGELFIQATEMAGRYSYYNYRDFIAFFERMALKRHLSAQLFLAFVYDKGLLGITADEEKAHAYYEDTFNQGDAYMHYNLGVLFEKGHWLQQSYEEARKCYESAAQKGHPEAQGILIKFYSYGAGTVVSNLERARYWRAQMAEKKILPTILAPELAPNPPAGQRFFSSVSKSFLSDKQKEPRDDISTRYVQRVEVLYDFVADRDDRLSVKKNEVLYVLARNGDWWHCERQTYPYQDGKVPSTFLEVLAMLAPSLSVPSLEDTALLTTVDLPATAMAITEPELQMIRKLGEGSFGEVYQAWCPRLNLLVAVKQSRSMACADDSTREEFAHELRVMAHLRHPNIVALCAYTRDTVIAHLVMEFMPGGELWDYLGGNEGKRPFLPWPTRVSIALNIANGLAYLHRERMLHRDLKSKNVLLCPYGSNLYFAKLADFGLVYKRDEIGSLQTLYDKATAGTPAWMAPELLIDTKGQSGRGYRPASDVYSLAMVLWELVAQKEPYLMLGRGNFIQLAIAKHVCDERLREIIPAKTPPWMRNLIEGGWAQDPYARLSLNTIITELRAALNAMGISGGEIQVGASNAESSAIAEDTAQDLEGAIDIPGFELILAGEGELSLYQAVATQLRLTDRRFLCELPEGGALYHRLKQLVYERSQMGNSYPDLTIENNIQQLVECTNSIIAIIDTRYPEKGFFGYCVNELGLREKSYDVVRMPSGVPIVRLAFTGMRYLSVKLHPALEAGVIREACRVGEGQDEAVMRAPLNLRLSNSSFAFVNQMNAAEGAPCLDLSRHGNKGKEEAEEGIGRVFKLG